MQTLWVCILPLFSDSLELAISTIGMGRRMTKTNVIFSFWITGSLAVLKRELEKP